MLELPLLVYKPLIIITELSKVVTISRLLY